MENRLKPVVEQVRQERCVPTVSALLPDGSLVEMIYDARKRRTAFVRSRDGSWSEEASVTVDSLRRLVPYSPNNNLITNSVVLFPSHPEEYGSDTELITEIQTFIHRYVDVTPLFEKVASYYVLFTWVYDTFNELPYLRLRGEPGSGKTRFLLTVGSLCYKPIFASGASTVSPLFRLLDTFRGTLVMDEGDFRFSDERAELVKILNNGNGRGFPVLRSEATGRRGEFNPRAYTVFGPKLVATRGYFEDRALESRCLTEETGQKPLRHDIPINLPSSHKDEALHLRNKLLLFRLRNFARCAPGEALVNRSIEPRLSQIFVPLLSVIDDERARTELRELSRRYHQELVAERGLDAEAQVLEIVRGLLASSEGGRISVKDIASWFIDRHAEEYQFKVTPRWVGNIVRRRLRLKTVKSHGNYVIPSEELKKLDFLYERYGIAPSEENAERVDLGDVGDFGREERSQEGR